MWRVTCRISGVSRLYTLANRPIVLVDRTLVVVTKENRNGGCPQRMKRDGDACVVCVEFDYGRT